MNGIRTIVLSATAALALVSCSTMRDGVERGAPLTLAKGGDTVYAIVEPENATEVDGYAIRMLREFLRQKTGAEFPVEAPGDVKPGGKYIFVGMSQPVRERLDDNDSLMNLNDQGHVAKTIEYDVFLYGKGSHGNLYAVLDFMETTLGRRWFSRFDEPVFDVEKSLVVKPFARRRDVSFPYRQGLWHVVEFDYQNGINARFSERAAACKAKTGKEMFPSGVTSRHDKRTISGVHSLDQFIPATPSRRLWPQYQWIEKRNYFETNPEFFTLDESGKRNPNRQLCLSNPRLRQELTKNILEYIHRHGEDAVVTLGAADGGGHFCKCPECEKLESKYDSPGGPLYDYLLELSETLKREHPKALIKVLAYRGSQTQRPPTLPEGVAFPDNAYVVFAHVDDPINVDWNNPKCGTTLEDLRNWTRLTPHVLIWSYPIPYARGANMPFSNIRRLVTNLRLAKDAGAEGVYQEYATNRVHHGYDFAELHIYLFAKLAMDADVDIEELIRDFTDHQYGAAAPLVRQYLDELETAVETSSTPTPMTPTSYECFPYLTVENIQHWQTLFDQMTERAADDPRALANVNRLRRNLDYVTLMKWTELAECYPATYQDHAVFEKRFKTAVPDSKDYGDLNDFLIRIQAGGKEKPLPTRFDGIDRSRIKRFVPENKGKSSGRKVVLDPAAAFGYAATVFRGIDRDLPFNFGFFKNRIGAKKPPWGTSGAIRSLNRGDIEPGVYRLYELGPVTVTPSCRVWLQVNQGWATNLDLGERLFDVTDPSPESNRWNVYVSLKFDGPVYGGKAEKNEVLCDQIILVKGE